MKERADDNAGPRATDLRNFKPLQDWLKEKRMTYAEWESRQAKPGQRASSPLGVLRAKLELADAQTRRR
ncbi:MAG: hypothetical protein ACYC0P_03800 [Thiobacillus sp.]